MTALSFDITKDITEQENELALKLQVAALTRDAVEWDRLRKHPLIVGLFDRGVLKFKPSCCDF